MFPSTSTVAILFGGALLALLLGRGISGIATTIAAAVEEQGSATHEIARSVQQAATGTREVSQNVAVASQGTEHSRSLRKRPLDPLAPIAAEAR